MKVKVWLNVGFGPSTERRDVLDIEDDATPEEIEEAARDWAFNFIEWGHEIAEKVESQ